MTAAEIRATPVDRFIGQAMAVVDSAPVLGIFAACEWAELDEDGHVWIAAIVRETLAQAVHLHPDGTPRR